MNSELAILAQHQTLRQNDPQFESSLRQYDPISKKRKQKEKKRKNVLSHLSSPISQVL